MEFRSNLITFTLFVRNVIAVKDFYSKFLNFKSVHEASLVTGKKVVIMEYEFNPVFAICLEEAISDSQKELVGRQAGDNVLFNINIEGCVKHYENLKKLGLVFEKELTILPHANFFIIKDPSGNKIGFSETFSDRIQWDK